MPGPIQSIERAAAILRLLADGSRRLGVSEIADSLGLARGTAHGILRTLQLVGFVEQDNESGKYQLGAALLHLGTSYLDVNELRSRAINWADPLAARSGEAVRLGTLLERQVLIVHHVFRPDDTLQMLDVGSLLPRTPARSERCCSPSTRTRPPSRRPTWSATPGVRLPRPRHSNRALAGSASTAGRRRSRSCIPAKPQLPCRFAATVASWLVRSESAVPVERICDGSGEPRVGLVGYVGTRRAQSLATLVRLGGDRAP